MCTFSYNGNAFANSALPEVSHLHPGRNATLTYRPQGAAAEPSWIVAFKVSHHGTKTRSFARLHVQNDGCGNP